MRIVRQRRNGFRVRGAFKARVFISGVELLCIFANMNGMLSGEELVDRLSEHLFWDVDCARVDPQVHARFLICRVMERGTREDVRAVWEYYGEEQVREVLTKAPSLTAKTIAFFANQFALPREAFRAHQRAKNWPE